MGRSGSRFRKAPRCERDAEPLALLAVRQRLDDDEAPSFLRGERAIGVPFHFLYVLALELASCIADWPKEVDRLGEGLDEHRGTLTK